MRLVASGKVKYAQHAARHLQEFHGINISHDTVGCALKEAGFIPARKPKKPRLTYQQKKARKEFAERHENWSDADWRHVIFSDETIITRFGNKQGQWIWRRPREVLRDVDVRGTMKFGGGSLMLWGCMTADGVGFACKIEGKMDANLYILILGDEFLETLAHYERSKDDTIFQQDNAPAHTTKKVKE